jgi:rSAM/selenodomain-associated transferase 1
VSGVLVVFAKEPRPGHVKTRMIPPLAPDEASGLYACLLDDVLDTMARVAPPLGLEPVLALHPPECVPGFARRVPPAFRVVAQRGRDLSERMAWAVAEAGAAGVTPIVLRGSDSPTLDGDTLAEALEALREVDLVVTPDLDGGYSLVGLRGPASGVFAHPMSTPSVLDDTLAHAARLGLRTRRLAARFDLDTVLDLASLRDARRTRVELPCPRTLHFLDQHDLWRHLDAPERESRDTLPRR